MSILVSTHNLTKTYGARPLFDGLTLAIESGERIGLIGPNGAGKSTLLRILAGQASPDGGTLSLQRGLRVGFLEQVPAFTPGATVLATVLEGTPGKGRADHDDWESLALAQELVSKLDLPADAPLEKLSGGWKKRVALARELARKPDLLLLDEPTNHLDVETILWLEEFLAGARFATLTVTHDRLFLQRVANRILELDRRNAGGLLSVKGDYATYLETKEQLMSAQERHEVILKNTLRRETEWLRRGAKARTTKQQARIKRAGELADEVDELASRNISRTARIDFQGLDRSPKRLLEAQAISKSYGGAPLFKGLDLLLTPGTRVGLLGPNGCGKSTLIRVLLGEIPPDAGSVTRSEGLSVAYFEQSRESLDPALTVSETLCPRGDHVEYRGSRIHIRSYLDRFLFSPAQMDMKIANLSGGEQSRVLLAKLMLQPANLLVLDEPTNDLDLPTLGVLEQCLLDFPGAILFVTHDRYFLDQVATKILAFGDERLVAFASIEQWEAWQLERAHTAAREQKEKAEKSRVAAQAGASKPAPGQKRKLSYNEQRELETMEERIHKAEAELAALAAESARPDVITNASRLVEVSKAMAKLETDIAHLYHRWGELES